MHDRTLPQVEPSEDVPRVHTVKLVLPLPPRVSQMGSVSGRAKAKKKNAYRRRCWLTACQQSRPLREPPEKVVATAVWYTGNPQDEDNMWGRLKWAADSLKQDQPGKAYWREGVADLCGYFVDDSPAHLEWAGVRQETDRENPRLEITLRWQVPEEPTDE